MQDFQSVSGWVMWNLSSAWVSSSSPASSSLSCMWVYSVSGRAAAAWTASMQAWSRATGSKLAKKPMSPTMGLSFSSWQSQLGLTSMARLMWKHGRPSTMALVYSAIL